MASSPGGREWVRGEATRCAFCLQQVDASYRTVCPRCRALYHRDCWRANDSRCAVYGCERVAPPVPPRVPVTTGPGGGSSWGGRQWWIIGFLIMVGLNFARFTSKSRPHPQVDRIRIPGDPWMSRDAKLQEAQNLVEETQPFIVDLEERTVLPEDPESRTELARGFESAASTLVRAREICLKYGKTWEDPSHGLRLQAATESLERLRKAWMELIRTRE